MSTTTEHKVASWTDEYEEIQEVFEETWQEGVGFMASIFEMPFAAMPRAEMYQAEVVPEEFPNQRRMKVANWHPEDQVAFCGGEYATASYNH